MEVGQEALDDLELVARTEEDAGAAGVGLEVVIGIFCVLGAVFEGAGGRGSGSDDPSFLRDSGVESGGGGLGQGVVLGVEADVGEELGADGLEGAEADVEGDGFDLDALCFQRV